HHHHNGWRQCHQKDHCEPPLRRVNAHLTQNLEPLPYHIGKIIENLSEVAASLALQHDRGYEELDIHQRDPFRQIDERVAYWKAKFLLFKQLTKFSGDRLRDLIGD